MLVLGFGAAMLLIDGAMLCAIFFRSRLPSCGGCCGYSDASSPPPPCEWGACRVSPQTELNLFSGLSHVVADTLRSLTQVVVGGVIVGGGPSAIVDAYGTLAISATILLGSVALLYEVVVQWRSEVSEQRGSGLQHEACGLRKLTCTR